MPKYSKNLTCPTSSSHAKRTETKLKVSQGVITQVRVTWSFGSNFLNALVVTHNGAQIIPSLGGGECRGNGHPDPWPEYILLEESHPELVIQVWNDGNEHEQDVLIDIVILPEMPAWAEPIRKLADMLELVLGLK